MAVINILDKNTIDQIAAGEVVERPLNVVKELTENAIDSNATSITVEIKDGGSSLIRVTDNGSGIPKTEIKKAFMRHATSKIVDAADLLKLSSLGFRGEALSSISAVSYVECITKPHDELLGLRYVIEGSREIEFQEIGAPDGTTFIVKDLFFNVPARKKFLKSNQTEGSYITDLMEHLALSTPDISYKYIVNNKEIFNTSGNGDLKEVIYRIYGKEISDSVLDIDIENDLFKAHGFIGKPEINRSSRVNETLFVNGRYVQCDVLLKAVEEGYKNFLMQHKFPFVVIHFEINPSWIDVNVHPSKMEIRLQNAKEIYDLVVESINDRLENISLIPSVKLEDEVLIEEKPSKGPEFFEINRIKLNDNADIKPLSIKNIDDNQAKTVKVIEPLKITRPILDEVSSNVIKQKEIIDIESPSQLSLFDADFLSEEAKPSYEILGQIFKTYWLIAFEDKLFFMDQHAAHEKVKYERILKQVKEKSILTQNVNPPIIINLTGKQCGIVTEYTEIFNNLGINVEDFGLGAVAIRSMPLDLYGCNEKEFFLRLLDEIIENPLKGSYDVILEKIASMACKAAVKGNTKMSMDEVKALLDELMTLDNPYNCPHGRPTIFSMSKYEIEKKFKRIVN